MEKISLNQLTNATMKDLPETEKPYEKCLQHGPQYLSEAELLTVILRTGAQGMSALDMSRSIIAMLGDEGICGLYHLSREDLMQIRGIGKVKAIQIACIAELSRRIARSQIGSAGSVDFTNPEQVGMYFMEDLRHESRERLLVLSLNSKGRLLGRDFLSMGTVNMTVASPRDIYLSALSHRAVSIILIHNHPSGDPTPSQADLDLTERVRKTGELVGIPLLDHIIIGDRQIVSFAQNGYIS